VIRGIVAPRAPHRQQKDLSYESDPLPTSGSFFPEIGKERNGLFFP